MRATHCKSHVLSNPVLHRLRRAVFLFLLELSLPTTQTFTMAPVKSKKGATNTKWSVDFDTLRREDLFRNPPTDHSAYPALQAAIEPHINAFNALFEQDGLIAQGLKDIGPKTYLDGDERTGTAGKNRLTVRIKELFVEKAMLPTSNKFSTINREIMPAECRERHVTYRGRLSARLEYRINGGDPVEFIRDLGQIPLMLKVCCKGALIERRKLIPCSQIGAISRTTPRRNSSTERKNPRNWVDSSWSTVSRSSFDS